MLCNLIENWKQDWQEETLRCKTTWRCLRKSSKDKSCLSWHNTVKPRYNEGTRDWQGFVISRVFSIPRGARPKASQREFIIITWAALCISGSWPDVIHRLWKKFLYYQWITSNFIQCKWPGVSNRWKSMIGKPIDQTISIEKQWVIGIGWCQSIDDQSITTQKPFIDSYRLAQQPPTDVTHATCPIIRHF